MRLQAHPPRSGAAHALFRRHAPLHPSARAARPARLLVALVATAILLAPFVWWAASQDQTFFGMAEKAMHSTGPSTNPLRWLRGTASLAVALIGFVVPSALLLPFLYRGACLTPGGGTEDNRDWQRVYLIAMAAGALVVLVAVFFVGVTSFKTRWMHEVALPFFIWFFLRVRAAGASADAHRMLVVFAFGFMILVALVRIGIYALHGHDCMNCRDYWPMQTYADGLRKVGFDHGSIVAPRFDLAGDLRYVMPEARLLTPGYPPAVFGPERGGQCAVVWEGEGDPPDKLMQYVKGVLAAESDANAIRGRVTGTLHTATDRKSTMSYILLPAGAGHCR